MRGLRRRPRPGPDPQAPCPLATAPRETRHRGHRGLRADQHAGPRGDRASQGRGQPQGHQPRAGRGGSRAGAVFGVFAFVFLLLTIAWALDSVLIAGAGDIWIGFAIVIGGAAAAGVSRSCSRCASCGGAAGADDGDRARPRRSATPSRRRAGSRADGDPLDSPEEIRASIEQNRQELGSSLEKLRGRGRPADRLASQLRRHQREVLIGAAVAGFVLGGGIAALGAARLGRRRRRHRR